MKRHFLTYIVLIWVAFSFNPTKAIAQCALPPITASNGFNLSAQSSNDATITNHIWKDEAGNTYTPSSNQKVPGTTYWASRITVTIDQDYYVYAVNSSGCTSTGAVVRPTPTGGGGGTGGGTVVINSSGDMISGPTSYVCSSTSTFKLYTTSSGSPFYWNGPGITTNTSGSEIYPKQSGRYTIQSSTGATAYKDVVFIQATPATPEFLSGSSKLCKGSDPSIYSVKLHDYSTYSWSLSPSTAGTISPSSNSATVTWNPSFSQNATVKVIEYGCDGTSNASATRSVYFTDPKTPTAYDKAGCLGPGGTLSAYSDDVGITGHVWKDSKGSTVPLKDNGPPPAGHAWVSSIEIPGDFPGTYTYTVYAVVNGCISPSKTVSYTVMPSQTLSITSSADPSTVCPGDSSFKLTALGGSSPYHWNGPGISPDYSATEIYPKQTGKYTLSANGNCNIMLSASKNVTFLSATPTSPVFQSGPAKVCKGSSPSTYSVAFNSHDSYVWSLTPSSAGSISGSSNSATVNWDSTFIGKATIQVVEYGCDGETHATGTQKVSVESPPTAPFANNEYRCGGATSISAYSYEDEVTAHKYYYAGGGLIKKVPVSVTDGHTSVCYLTIDTTTTFEVAAISEQSGCPETEGPRKQFTITVGNVPKPIAPFASDKYTTTGGVTLQAQSNDPQITNHLWFDENGTSLETKQNGPPYERAPEYVSSIDVTIGHNATFYVQAVKDIQGCEIYYSDKYPVRVILVPPVSTTPTITIDNTLSIPVNISTVLTASGAVGNQSYHWYSSGGTLLHDGNNFLTPILTEATTYYVAIYNVYAPSYESTRKAVTVNVYHLPIVNVGTNVSLLLPTNSITLTGSASDEDGGTLSLLWEKIGGTATMSGASTSTLSVSGLVAGKYLFRLTATDEEGHSSSDDIEVTVVSPQDNYNYIRETVVLVGGKTEISQLASIPVTQKSVSTTYFDGLGREMQKVGWQSSPLKKDVVQPLVYDRFGRDSVLYLPYTSSTSNGFYKTTFKTDQSRFYLRVEDYIVNDSFPVALTFYEDSPLNRVKEHGSPGKPWQPIALVAKGGGKTTQMDYAVYTENDVKLWTINPTTDLPQSSSNYGIGEILMATNYDEHHIPSKQYKDKEGHIILVRKQDSVNVWLDTYYIYDITGNLRYVLPPECVARWTAASDKNAHLDTWAFRYKYDERKRLIEKKMPGAGRMVMVYDKLDRLVLSQDAVQAKKNQWTYTKYDVLGKPIITGLYTDSRSLGSIKADVEAQVKLYEEPSTTGHGYTQTNCYPVNASNNEVLTVSYYDDYRFLNESWFEETSGRNYNYFSGKTGYPSNYNTRIKGLLTGQKVKVLGENNWLNSVSYYDNKYRMIRVIAENAVGGADTVSTSYDFVGKIMSARREHSGIESTVSTRLYEYDHAGRLEKLWHQVGDDPQKKVLLAQNIYNELGQLIDKGIGVDVNTNTAVQSIDYRYNIRGWLKSINRSDLGMDTNGEKNDDNNDLFGMELLYNEVLAP